MPKYLWAIVAVAALGYATWRTVAVEGQASEMQIVTRAADALGGKTRILSLKSLTIIGTAEYADLNGGSNVTGSPYAPQKWQDGLEYTQTIDLEHNRARVQQRRLDNFVFAREAPQLGLVKANEVVDGDIAYNVAENGRATRASAEAARRRRIDMLANPVSIVRAALDRAAKLSNLRKEGTAQVIDVTTAQGNKLTVGFDGTTNLPAWVSWVAPDPNLGDVTYRDYFTGYDPVGGVLLPLGYNTVIDFRNVVSSKVYVDRNIVDAPVADMTAPPEIKAAVVQPAAPNLQATKVADGVWWVAGTTVFEFADHLTLFELYGPEPTTMAILKVVRGLVPSKPVTQVIVSHHHFDHSASLRTAVSEGLTIISRRGNQQIFEEMTSRPAKVFPDALGRNAKPLKFIPVDDHLALKDSAMEVDVYHVIGNIHMADAVFAHVPRHDFLAEGDLQLSEWDYQWWGGSFMDNIEYRKIKADKVLPVHGAITNVSTVVAQIEKQVRNAQELCSRAAAAKFYQPGCPVQYTRQLPN
jgi:hypothetical protein